jgi:circadian clock protein KaiC
MSEELAIERVPSGVAGLDTILRGGFTKGGIHLLQGTPGAGKTTLANQICFHHAALGGQALFVTLLAETHTRMLLHLGTMRFFNASRLPEQISYISGFGVLQSEGLPGLVTLLRREIAARKVTVMVLDGLVTAKDRAASDTEFKTFVQELQTQAGLHGCTVFLLTTAKGQTTPPSTPWWTGSSS